MDRPEWWNDDEVEALSAILCRLDGWNPNVPAFRDASKYDARRMLDFFDFTGLYLDTSNFDPEKIGW